MSGERLPNVKRVKEIKIGPITDSDQAAIFRDFIRSSERNNAVGQAGGQPSAAASGSGRQAGDRLRPDLERVKEIQIGLSNDPDQAASIFREFIRGCEKNNASDEAARRQPSGGVASDSVRSPPAGMKVKARDWNFEELLKLVAAKRHEWEHVANTGPSKQPHRKEKWNKIADYMLAKGVADPVRDGQSCKKRWGRLANDWKRVFDYEKTILRKSRSYFAIKYSEKKGMGLPVNFNKELFLAIADWFPLVPEDNSPHPVPTSISLAQPGHKMELPSIPVIRAPVLRFSSSSMAETLDDVAPAQTRVGWIGTGVMGQAMAGHILAAGFQVTVFNRTRSKADDLVSKGARYAESPLAVAQQSDVVFTIVGYPTDVRQVVLGEKGILHGLRKGGIFVDMTTSEPSLAREIYAAAKEKSVDAVDAPVSGGDKGAKAGTLAIMAGGLEQTVKTLTPLFKVMGSCTYLGPSGSGQSCKLANQVTIASTMVGLVEGLIYAHKAGLDVSTYLQAVSGGAAGSKSMELYSSRIQSRDFAPGFYINHFVKDLGIALNECQRMGLALPGLALAQQLYVSLKGYGEGDLGTQALILSLERLNNIKR